jgi:predicted MFS family arabinose efflux permease
MQALVQLYRNAYSGLSKETWFLSLVILINRSGTMVVPFMTMYATQKLHYTILQAGFIMAIFGFGSIAGAYVGGRLTDTIGFYKIQLFALVGGGIMFIVLGYLQRYTLLCIGTFILSAVNESFRPANSTAIAYYSKADNRTRSYSLNRLAINLGWAFGGALGGFLAGFNYHLLFWVDGLTNISAAVLLIFVLPYPEKLKSSLHENKLKASTGSSAYQDKPYLLFSLLTVFFSFCFFQLFTILPVFMKTQLGISEQLIGVLMAVNGLIIAFIEMVIIYKLEAKQKPLMFMKYGVWMVGLSYAIFNIFSGHFYLALASTLIITFGEIFSMPFMNSYWIGRSSEHNRGQYAALYTISWGIGQVAAPSVGGYLVEVYSYNLLWWVVFIITLIAGFGYSRLSPIRA